jgi:chorismate mutase
MELDQLLKTYRDQIDTIDIEIIYLLSRRFLLVEQIWEIKKETWDNPLQPQRWEDILNNLYLEADDKNISRILIKEIWDSIHKESLKIEH